MKKFLVTIATQNSEGKVFEHEFETETIFGATRIIHTFKGRRGYVPFSWRVDEVEVLV